MSDEPDGFAQPMSARELCSRCGRKWHPPALCWAYDWLSEDDIETIAANIYNRAFDERELERAAIVWEGEGGR